MGTIIHIKADGTRKERPAYHPPSYEECKQAIASGTEDALIEIVRVLYKDEPAQMIVHESGLLLGLPRNEEATELYRATICSKEEFDHRMKNYKEMGFAVVGQTKYNPTPDIVGDVLLLVGKDVELD